ncbi:MAG TPA: hypothetical protein VMF11_10920 [Candidatus Baltobacteraceae bacterium]|nr:hypothetical protein [Candidatus Baltobacteraceae bacterium]
MSIRVVTAVILALVVSASIENARAALTPLAFDATFEGHFWNDYQKHASARFSITPNADGASVQSVENGKTTSGEVTVKDGQLSAVSGVWEIEAYNDLVRLTEDNAKPFAVGSTWRSKVPVQVDNTRFDDVPVTVTVASVDGPKVVLQATGTLSENAMLRGYSTPIVLDVSAAMAIVDGQIAAGRLAVSDDVKSMIGEQQLNWQWTLAPARSM